MRLQGSIVALVTPFAKGKIATDKISSLVEWHVQEGTKGIVVCGTTGEGPLLSLDEKKDVIKAAVKASNKRVPIIACATEFSHDAVLVTAKLATELGADYLLLSMPPYIKPSQNGLIDFVKTIHEAQDLPMILYNNPGRAACGLEVATVAKLAELPRVRGIKDSSTDLTRLLALKSLIKRDDFSFLSGDDPTSSFYYAMGGDGCISVTANVLPQKSQEIFNSFDQGYRKKFIQLSQELLPLQQVMFIETNPTPVKLALSLLGQCDNTFKMPLSGVSKTAEEKIKTILAQLSLTPSKTAI